MKLREKKPIRSKNVAKQADYHAYRDQLAEDFNHRCGYCDDKDLPRAASYEIDHFVPKSLDVSRKTDYNNLVYACKSCNRAKWNKWPTKNKDIHNDGRVGWIDPCSTDYDAQFERRNDGKIQPITELGCWMYENLKLWKKQHEILWNCERLEDNINKLENLNIKGMLPEQQKDSLIQLYQMYRRVIHSFYGN